MTFTPAVPSCMFHAVLDWNQTHTPSDSGHRAAFDTWLAATHEGGFDALLCSLPTGNASLHPDLIDSLEGDTDQAIRTWSEAAKSAHIALFLDVDISRVAAEGELARAWPHAYRSGQHSGIVDPRLSAKDNATAFLTFDNDFCDNGLLDFWVTRLVEWNRSGVHGFRLRQLSKIPAPVVVELIARTRAQVEQVLFFGDTPGASPQQLNALKAAQFDAVYSSLPWWDYASPWLSEEHDRLVSVAPVTIANAWLSPDTLNSEHWDTPLWTAAITGQVFMVSTPVPMSEAVALSVRRAVTWHKTAGTMDRSYRVLTGTAARYTALFRGDGLAYPDAASNDNAAFLFLINTDDKNATPVDWASLRSRLPGGYSTLTSLSPTGAMTHDDLPAEIPAGAVLKLRVQREPVALAAGSMAEQDTRVRLALSAPRIAIEAVSPVVDAGRFPLKRVVGEPITVEADVFMDGHDHLAITLQWRAVDEIGWHSQPMRLLNNDRYQATFAGARIGRHEFKIRAWRDAWDTYRDELQKKHDAHLDLSLELEEGRILIAETRTHLPENEVALIEAISSLLATIGQPVGQSVRRGQSQTRPIPAMNVDHVALLLSDETAHLMEAAATQPYASESDVFPVNVERQAAKFASWYELFPRSLSGTTERHGNFDDVIARLPAIRDMGFDVLYFPPIHPIGLSNRKGKNNTLDAGADQPGSPYAIGAESGGHSDIHPELGTLADFQRLVTAAHAHGLEIALDFAIQCSPDHPWLKTHPDWFAWRADGSMRYAENPPKKYQDIVNVDFYSATADTEERAALWMALRDVVLFWAEHGVRTFRVDNPHTKPLPFWEWMIGEVQAKYPDALFLSEAFTRPKMMYRLAKAGFSQSYTYFTWRETKAELTAYLTELNQSPAKDIFRPNFFVNTPDINPHFLQRSGRAGFLIRMALATTTSGLWGMYSGFELCDAEPMPGKEEYLNSEKYEVRAWDWAQPGNIIAEMTAMNHIRRRNPALQSHLGLTFETVYDDNILLFSKATPERDNVVLVAVSVDPFNVRRATFELPLWSLGLPDDASLQVTDLLSGNAFTWQGKYQQVELTPDMPYAVWRLR